MKIFLGSALGLVALLVPGIFVVYLAGSRMPREHRSLVVVTLRASRAAVWAAITDYAAMSGWWPAVKAVRTEKPADGTVLTWNKDRHREEVPFRIGESRPAERLRWCLTSGVIK